MMNQVMNHDRSREVVELVRGVRLQPRYRDQALLDCRCFLLGDRVRQLVRAYGEAIYRMSRNGDAALSAAEVLDSAEIRQYYDVSVVDSCVKLTLHDAAFQEQYPLSSGDFSLRITAGSRAVTVPLPLERFRALGRLVPLLAGNHGEADIAARLKETQAPDEQEWCRGLLATLDAQHCLQRRRIRSNSFLVSPVHPRVTFVGHTSILLQTASAAILTDPLLRVDLSLSPAKAFDVSRLDLNA